MPSDSKVSPARASRPAIDVDVVMRREPVLWPMARWQPWRWMLADVLPAHEPRAVEPLPGAVVAESASCWLFPGHRVTLFHNDTEGCFLNTASPSPCLWVFWRLDDARLLHGEPMAVPQIVTLSDHDAGRWLDAQEKVDQVPAPAPVVEWLSDSVAEHHRTEPKRRQRPASFQPLTDRFGQPVSISTDKRRGPRPTGADA